MTTGAAATGGAGVAQLCALATVVAAQVIGAAMHGHRDAAVRTLDCSATINALQERRPTTPIEQQEHLLAASKCRGHRILEWRRPWEVAACQQWGGAEIDQLDRRERMRTDSIREPDHGAPS